MRGPTEREYRCPRTRVLNGEVRPCNRLLVTGEFCGRVTVYCDRCKALVTIRERTPVAEMTAAAAMT